MDRTSAILACGVTFLLCGAIGVDTRARLQGNGVGVIPWLTGRIDEVVAAYQDGTLAGLTMPGCRRPGTDSGERPPQARKGRE
ncbi:MULTISPECIES: NifB/NifX family molybdenum-iron cluster-binding protein [Pseudodesulfovibrio]|nr:MULTISPECIES: NifB/NifX family molybdenum-iron cluster-binding protein [Pseudodesulfovibrio]MCG2732552.1 NifB/NifX family molybdenum-iron cluster-binding protein [Pseudodesulfovibrio aespoeensis]